MTATTVISLAAKTSAGSTVAGVVILLAFVGAAWWGIRWSVRRQRAWEALSPEEQEHLRAVRAADKGVKRANRDYNRAVSSARAELEGAMKPRGLGSFNGVVLDDQGIRLRAVSTG